MKYEGLDDLDFFAHNDEIDEINHNFYMREIERYRWYGRLARTIITAIAVVIVTIIVVDSVFFRLD